MKEIKKAYEIPNGDYLTLSDDDIIWKVYQKVNNDSRFVNVKPLFPTMFPQGGVISALDKFEKKNKHLWRRIDEVV